MLDFFLFFLEGEIECFGLEFEFGGILWNVLECFGLEFEFGGVL